MGTPAARSMKSRAGSSSPLVGRPTNGGVRQASPVPSKGASTAAASRQRLTCITSTGGGPSLTAARRTRSDRSPAADASDASSQRTITEHVEHAPTYCAATGPRHRSAMHRRVARTSRPSNQAAGGPRAGNARSRKQTTGTSWSSERTVDVPGATVDEDAQPCAPSVSSSGSSSSGSLTSSARGAGLWWKATAPPWGRLRATASAFDAVACCSPGSPAATKRGADPKPNRIAREKNAVRAR